MKNPSLVQYRSFFSMTRFQTSLHMYCLPTPLSCFKLLCYIGTMFCPWRADQDIIGQLGSEQRQPRLRRSQHPSHIRRTHKRPPPAPLLDRSTLLLPDPASCIPCRRRLVIAFRALLPATRARVPASLFFSVRRKLDAAPIRVLEHTVGGSEADCLLLRVGSS